MAAEGTIRLRMAKKPVQGDGFTRIERCCAKPQPTVGRITVASADSQHAQFYCMKCDKFYADLAWKTEDPR